MDPPGSTDASDLRIPLPPRSIDNDDTSLISSIDATRSRGYQEYADWKHTKWGEDEFDNLVVNSDEVDFSLFDSVDIVERMLKTGSQVREKISSNVYRLKVKFSTILGLPVSQERPRFFSAEDEEINRLPPGEEERIPVGDGFQSCSEDDDNVVVSPVSTRTCLEPQFDCEIPDVTPTWLNFGDILKGAAGKLGEVMAPIVDSGVKAYVKASEELDMDN